MNAAVMTSKSRDPFMPARAQRTGPALGLALFAHALLIAALAFGVNWRDSEPTSVAAELWSAVPQAAAPRAVEAPTPPPPPPPRAEARKPEPVAPPKPEAPAAPDPQIAIEKAKREEARRQQAEEDRQEKIEKAQRAKEEAAKKKAAADQLAKDELAKRKADAEKADKLAKEKAEKADKADAAKQAALREANLKRMQGLAGATGGATDTGSAMQSSAPSASYAGRIMARIKPNIVLTDPVDGNPMASVEVRLAPDGTIIGKRLLKSSGSKAWDDAVLRAIERTEILPRDTDGRVRTPIEIDFRPRD